MTQKEIVRELEARGYTVTETTVTKNGIQLSGITIGSGNIRPTIYTDEFASVPNSELNYVVDKIVEMVCEEVSEVDLSCLQDWKWVKNNLILCVQRQTEEDLVKENFLDLEIYIRINVKVGNDGGTIKLTPQLMNMIGKSKREFFEAAWENTEKQLEIVSIKTLFGFETPAPMYVGTSTDKNYGASVMLFPDKIKDVADIFESDLVIIPSSIHEILLTPKEKVNLDYLNELIIVVNNNELKPEEILNNHFYIFHRDTMEITANS